MSLHGNSHSITFQTRHLPLSVELDLYFTNCQYSNWTYVNTSSNHTFDCLDYLIKKTAIQIMWISGQLYPNSSVILPELKFDWIWLLRASGSGVTWLFSQVAFYSCLCLTKWPDRREMSIARSRLRGPHNLCYPSDKTHLNFNRNDAQMGMLFT